MRLKRQCLVPVVPGTTRYNFDDAVSRVELIFEFDKNIAEKWVGFAGPTDENDRVCIIIKTVFSQELQSFV